MASGSKVALNENSHGEIMKNRRISIIVSLVVGSLIVCGIAFAHGTEKHGKKTDADVQMKKFHAMMPMFSVTTATMEAALEKGDAAALEAEAGKIVAAIPDLKKSKPHKNIKQRKKFVELATSLGIAVNSTVDLAKKSDFAGAKGAFKRVEAACAACHATFRD